MKVISSVERSGPFDSHEACSVADSIDMAVALLGNGGEGLTAPGEKNALQAAFHEHHALQCGFCTPGMLMTATDMLKKYPLESDDAIREGPPGNLCRCTGYEHIVAAVRAVKAKAAPKT